MTANDSLQSASTDADLLPVVDENDRVTGTATRRQAHLQGLRHRAVHVAVFDGQGRIWLQLRSRAKDVMGGFWDLSATGHVDPGETYGQAARRELREELGIDAEPKFVAKLDASQDTGWEFHALYWLRWDGPVDGFNRQEIDQARLFGPEEIRDALASPDSRWRLTPNVATEWEVLARAAAAQCPPRAVEP